MGCMSSNLAAKPAVAHVHSSSASSVSEGSASKASPVAASPVDSPEPVFKAEVVEEVASDHVVDDEAVEEVASEPVEDAESADQVEVAAEVEEQE